MGYTSININYNEGTLCEEISFTEPGEQSYTLGSTITLSDNRLSRDRQLIVRTVNYTEDESGGLFTTVSGFSLEYAYTRKAPDCDISFFTMTSAEQSDYEDQNPIPDSKIYYMRGDSYGVGGWSMYLIVNKIATEWMGLNVVNTLPDYEISSYAISVGSTFFEALNGLISEFEPLILIMDGTLYILERSGAGALSAGQIPIAGSMNRAVDREYIPLPGCIKVEGQEGEYFASKDPTALYSYCYGATITEKSSGKVVGEDGTEEDYAVKDTYYRDQYGLKWVIKSREQSSKLTDPDGNEINTKVSTESVYYDAVKYARNPNTLDYKYERPVLYADVETCEAEIDGSMIVYNMVNTKYMYDVVHWSSGILDWTFLGQITTKKELFIYDYSSGAYVPYDPRDYDLNDLLDTEDTVLVTSEIRTTKYSAITEESYAVDTIVASLKYIPEDDEWKTLYTFEHDIVEGGGQQQSSPTLRTLQVYAGDCPTSSAVVTVKDEPPRIFNISTPSWVSIADCYIYLAALVATEFQRVQVSLPIIDPLPLMAIGGLGSIIEAGISGKNYVRGYTIDIDPSSGYTTDLNLEARRA